MCRVVRKMSFGGNFEHREESQQAYHRMSDRMGVPRALSTRPRVIWANRHGELSVGRNIPLIPVRQSKLGGRQGVSFSKND